MCIFHFIILFISKHIKRERKALCSSILYCKTVLNGIRCTDNFHLLYVGEMSWVGNYIYVMDMHVVL